MALTGKNLANYLNKYSDVYISYYFFAYANSSTQFSIEYNSDYTKQRILINRPFS